MSSLFSPITIRNQVIKNRAWVSPMGQYSSVDGVISDWQFQWLGSLATGGHGLVITEATAISPEARITPACAGIWNDQQVAAWKPVTSFATSQGSAIFVQLAHAGRKGSSMPPWADRRIADPSEGGWTTLAPSDVSFPGLTTPHEASIPDLDKVVKDFETATFHARAAGFHGVEIHAGHGYLLHQFLSPLSNSRTDEYGGSFENRVRLIRRVVQAVRQAAGDGYPVFLRLSATDYVDGGWTLEESQQLAVLLKNDGVDLIDVSSGGNTPTPPPNIGPGYQVALATAIKQSSGILCGSVGLITEPQQADRLISEGLTDAVLLARAVMRNPYWARQAAESLGVYIDWPRQLERGRTLQKS